MLLVVAAGGTVVLENPQNSLVGMQGRFSWFVRLLLSFQIPASWLKIQNMNDHYLKNNFTKNV